MRKTLSTAASLVRAAFSIAGARAPAVLAGYSILTYLNRTSADRPIHEVPALANETGVGGGVPSPGLWDADILVPVFNDFVGIRGLLDVLRQEAPQFANVILVHDCSTDQRVTSLLCAFRDAVPNAQLLENARNSGFLESCNRGFDASTRDIVILNTDIELPRGALGRLLDTLRSDDDIASVTPFSSNAYGAGFPNLNYENARPFGATTEQIDRAFQAIGQLEPISIPRGVGFCLAMSRRAIDTVGIFDTAYGAGYGEESDFCLRAREAGFRNLLAPNAYVYHRAGQSFASSSKWRAREGLMRLLVRHPTYVRMVGDYLQSNEARAVGFAALARLIKDLTGQDAVPRHDGGGRPTWLGFEDEIYPFVFANVDVAEKAYELAGLTR